MNIAIAFILGGILGFSLCFTVVLFRELVKDIKFTNKEHSVYNGWANRSKDGFCTHLDKLPDDFKFPDNYCQKISDIKDLK